MQSKERRHIFPGTSSSWIWGVCGVQILGYKVIVAGRRGVEENKEWNVERCEVIRPMA